MKKIMMILCMLLFFVSSAQAVTIISVSPTVTNTVDTGSSFTVSVNVQDAVDLAGYQFELVYNPDIVRVGSVALSNFLETPERIVVTIPLMPEYDIDNDAGRLTCNRMTQGTGSGAYGSGTLVTVTFNRLSLSDDNLNLESVYLTDTKSKSYSLADKNLSIANGEVQPRYHITASVKSGSGTISPSGDVLVKPGESASFTVQPAGCWYTADVKVDGVSKSPPYTIPDVSANHTIDAYFQIRQFTISVCTANNGSISPSGNVTVNCGTSPKFTITPDKGYRIKDVIADAVSQGRIPEYTFPPISSGHNICAEFYPVPMGDIDGNDIVDLADAILALRILCGIDVGAQKIFIDADVNGDGKIGIEEVVYILQKVAELR